MASLDYQPGQLLPGTVYRVLRLIGVGGMGTVYDVEDTSIGKRYVVKTLHPKLGAREDLARRVLKEARTLARLNHPNIIEVITAGVTGDEAKLPYYVMERLNGQSLRMVIDKKGRLELSHAFHIGIDLLDALDHAHDKGLIHRDVKPDNIFLHRTAGGVTVTKLLDFGIVSVLDGGQSETAGRFLGTLRYAAPEQLKGEPPTAKMDVYAAALVIYEIAAGCGPFDDQGDAAAVGAAHVSKHAPRLSHHVPVPKEFDNLIAAALSKDPRMRPRDAFSFAASLRNMSRSLEAGAGRGGADAATRTTVSGVMGLVTQASPPTPGSGLPAPSPVPTAATLIGMPAPTVGPAVPAATTVPDAIDRMAATGTLPALQAGVGPAARNDTEAVGAPVEPALPALDDGATEPCGPPPDMDDPSISWPAAGAPTFSEQPHTRSLPAASPRSGRGPLVAVGAGVALLCLLGVFAAARRVASDAIPAMAAPPSSLPRPLEQDLVPAPILAPPAFDPGELSEPAHRRKPPAGADAPPSPPPSAVPAPAPSAAPSRPNVRPASPVAAPRAHPTPPVEERPGPGF